MKNLLFALALVFAASISFAQTKTVQLEQTTGEFTEKGLTLSEGSYIFEVTNNGVDHEVGFVLAPKGKTSKENHIQAAYLTKVAATGKTTSSKTVKLAKGEYVYFCPMNPTEEYPLTVK